MISAMMYGLVSGVILMSMFLLVYIYLAYALMKIAKKLDGRHSWFAFIPILNIFLLAKIADFGWVSVFLFFLISSIPKSGIFFGAIIWVMWWRSICFKLNRPKWYGFLMVVPVAPLILIYVLAWKD